MVVMVASVIVCRVLFAAGVHPQLNLAKKNRCFPLPKKALALVHLWALTPLPHHTQQDTKAMHKARRTQDKQSKCTSPTPTPPLTLQQTCLHSRGGSGEEWRGDVNGPARNPAGLPVQVRQHPESCLLFADQSSMYLCVSV